MLETHAGFAFRTTCFRLAARSILRCNVYFSRRGTQSIVYSETLPFNTLRDWERTRSAVFVTRIGAHKGISKGLQQTHAHTLAHACSVVSHLSARYPGMIAACVIYVRATCTRNLRAWSRVCAYVRASVRICEHVDSRSVESG